MKAMTISDVERNISDVLFQVKNGEKFKILQDNFQEPVAMIVPVGNNIISRNIGILDGKAKFTINGDGKISEEEFLGL